MKNFSQITLAIGFGLICSTSFGQTKETTKEVEVKENKINPPTPPVQDQNQKNEEKVYPQKMGRVVKQETVSIKQNEEVEIQETSTTAPVEVLAPQSQKSKPVVEVPVKVKPPLK